MSSPSTFFSLICLGPFHLPFPISPSLLLLLLLPLPALITSLSSSVPCTVLPPAPVIMLLFIYPFSYSLDYSLYCSFSKRVLFRHSSGVRHAWLPGSAARTYSVSVPCRWVNRWEQEGDPTPTPTGCGSPGCPHEAGGATDSAWRPAGRLCCSSCTGGALHHLAWTP